MLSVVYWKFIASPNEFPCDSVRKDRTLGAWKWPTVSTIPRTLFHVCLDSFPAGEYSSDNPGRILGGKTRERKKDKERKRR